MRLFILPVTDITPVFDGLSNIDKPAPIVKVFISVRFCNPLSSFILRLLSGTPLNETIPDDGEKKVKPEPILKVVTPVRGVNPLAS